MAFSEALPTMGDVVHGGGICFCEVWVRDEAGKEVALALVTYHL
jgi:hypothetical protein